MFAYEATSLLPVTIIFLSMSVPFPFEKSVVPYSASFLLNVFPSNSRNARHSIKLKLF